MPKPYFGPELFSFLRQLRQNNNRDWFLAHKEHYEREVRDPMLHFIQAAAGPLAKISRHVLADPRPSGGSLFRIHRDTRFSKDKSPYKTHLAAQFRHRAGKDVHAPCYYLHLEPGRVFLGAGLWRPDPETLQKIRTGLVKRPADWKRVVSGAAFRRMCRLEGDRAARAPRGFDPAHPLIEDLKRKDFIASATRTEAAACRPDFLKAFEAFCKASAPLNAFLAKAVGFDW